MRIPDKLRDLTTKARDSAAEHKDQIKQAVEKAETIADKRTGGKYHDRIAKTGAKVETYVEKLQPDASEQRQEGEPTPPEPANDGRQTPRDAAEGKTTAGAGQTHYPGHQTGYRGRGDRVCVDNVRDDPLT